MPGSPRRARQGRRLPVLCCGLFLFLLFNFASHVVQLPRIDLEEAPSNYRRNHMFSEVSPSLILLRGGSGGGSAKSRKMSTGGPGWADGKQNYVGGGLAAVSSLVSESHVGRRHHWWLESHNERLVTIRCVANGRWLWPSDGDAVMASADEEVELAAFGAVFEVVPVDEALEWVAFRQAALGGAFGSGGAVGARRDGRLLQFGAPPAMRLQLAPAGTPLWDHTTHFRIERLRAEATRRAATETAPPAVASAYRGRLLQRSFNVPLELTQADAPFGTLRGAAAAAKVHDADFASSLVSSTSFWSSSSSSSSPPVTFSMQNEALFFYFSGLSEAEALASVAAETTARRAEEEGARDRLARLPSLMSSVVPRAGRSRHKEDHTTAANAAAANYPSLPSGKAAGLVGPRGEKRVISYGLYGQDPKYIAGALRNVQLAPLFFPGWVCRFYCAESVPKHARAELRRLGAEVIMMDSDRESASIPDAAAAAAAAAGVGNVTNHGALEGVLASAGFREAVLGGAIAGMFWRFLVADDSTVDRFIVRDSDSRLNARDAFAVVDWIRSGRAVHSVRDHPNHDRPLNGGLWGATWGFLEACPALSPSFAYGGGAMSNYYDYQGNAGGGGAGDATGAYVSTRQKTADAKAADTMTGLVASYWNKETYGADLSFLQEIIWPRVQACKSHLAHDAYTCEKYPHTKPFPTKRPRNFQHVGQVFDAADQPRMDDIDGFMRGRVVPDKCRRRPEWKYG